MRPAFRFGLAGTPFLLLLAALIVFLHSVPGHSQVNPPKTPPANRPEVGLPGSKQPTTRPGSHESSAKDERDRVAGKFPAPKEKGGGTESDRRGVVGSTAYVDVTVLEADRQAVTLVRDDFHVVIDGQPRRIIAIHYVFRGPQALDAGRSMTVGNSVVARGDEARTVVVAVDENSFLPVEERRFLPVVQHTLDVLGPDDRAAVVPLPEAASVRFAGTHGELLAGVSRLMGRAEGAPGERPSFFALGRVLTDLLRLQGPKQVIVFSAGRAEAAPRNAANETEELPGVATAIDAAAASRSTIHVVTPSGRFESAALHSLTRATGGTVTRVTGQGRDLEPLGAALLGGYVLEVESNVNDRNGRPHRLSITTTRRGMRVLAAERWMPRKDPLPPLIVPTARPADPRKN
jgi:hypothetical protein